MAEPKNAHVDRSTMTGLPNQPAPPGANNEFRNTSIQTRPSSKSPQPNPPPPTESSTKLPNLESQPMTTSTSSSSLPPDQQASQSMDTIGASPYTYGTRSRNRTGNARPYYGEDAQEDFEWGSAKKSQAVSASAMPSTMPSGDSEKLSGTNTRRSSTTASGGPSANNKAANSNVQRDSLPGMSSFSLNPEPSTAPQAPSRKRKAPGHGPIASNTSSSVTQTTASGVPRRVAAPAASSASGANNLMTFDNCQGYLKNGRLRADDGTIFAVNDQIYLICEPPGEPYYLARIMEFLHIDNNHTLPVDALRVNWYFRPRDIQRKVNDTRVVFASMQSDTCPITSLRGKCRIAHRNDINDLDDYRKTKDSFWYEKMFDRYIHRYYEVIPTSQVINVPAKVKKVLDERWKFVVVEIGRGKELTSAIKSCKRCQGYCASNDSVDCAVCKNTYHMNCVRPPLLKKPARGFGWSCGPCSRKQEKKLEARNTPIVGERVLEGEEEELIDEEEDEHVAGPADGSDPDIQNSGPRPPTAEQIAQAKLWPYRYLGIHCRVEDALDYDDRIYPRASSRLGPKHQANVQVWHGRPVEFVKPVDVKKRYLKGSYHKKDAKMTKETVAALEADKMTKDQRPKWIMDEPLGYVPRGDDHLNSDLKNTAQLNFRLPQVGGVSSRGGDDISSTIGSDQREELVNDYMERAKKMAKSVGVDEYSTNFLDKALELWTSNDYQSEKALQQLQNVSLRKDLKEPVLTKDEIKRFEEGVARYGSELRLISRHVGKTQRHGEIVRYYYMWKKTPRGKQIWGNYEGRKGKKQAKQADSKLLDDVADDVDDSAFDNGKAASRKQGFECKFCATRRSPQWRRAPATAPGTTVPVDPTLKNSKDKSAHLMLALCQRCAGLWRKYGIQWENIDEVAKKVANGGGRAWKRRIDEELLIELVSANEASSIGMSTTAAAAAASVGMEVPPSLTIQPGQDGPKKKQKIGVDTQANLGTQNVIPSDLPKKKIVEKPPEPPLVPEPPIIRILPCAVCYHFEPVGTDEHLRCRHCRLTVHRNCYGVPEDRANDKWTCDMCTNDSSHQLSTTYDCILCPVREHTDTELHEPPKVSHKKKNDREREKERLEKELVDQAATLYYQHQEKKGRPRDPRQALKRTSGNNWVHVICAIFHLEIKFGDSKRLEPAEGIGAIPENRYTQCKLCKSSYGACINCSHCQASVHVACAQQYGYTLGFDLNPVKGSRSHAVNTVGMGSEVGNATAVVFCREHPPKHLIHPLSEISENSSLNALQVFARSHKQADTSLTGTVRKALMVDSAKKATTQSTNGGTNHRGSHSTATSGSLGNSASAPTTRSSRVSPSTFTVRSDEVDEEGDRVVHLNDVTTVEFNSKECTNCGADASPKWHEVKPKIVTEHRPPPVIESSIELPDAQSQPQDPVSNGHVNGDSSDLHDALPAPVSSSEGEPAVATNGGMNGDGNSDDEASILANIQSSDPAPNGGNAEPDSEDVTVADDSPKFLCHKCHLRKLKEPTPPRTPTPQPDPVQQETNPIPEPERSPPPMPLFWPSQVPQAPPAPPAPPHEPYQAWTSQPAPAYHGPERMSNGVPPSPPVVAPPPQHYPPPPPQYHHEPSQSTYRDHRGVLHRGIAPQYHVPYVVNGVLTEPPSFQYRRDSRGQLYQVPYVPPQLRPPHVPPHTNSIRSPPVQEQSLQGPNGPPEAAENPFAVPNTSHSPPRQSFGGIYGSPPGNYERAETPPEGYGRDGRWTSDGPMANGASASPSLRNLLH